MLVFHSAMMLRAISTIVFLIIFGPGVRADNLPPGIPDPIGPDGRATHAIMFTTKAYRNEAVRLVLAEANMVASELELTNELPITETNARLIYITPFGMSWLRGTVGNVETANYIYCVSQGKKFSYSVGTHQDEDCKRFSQLYQWPIADIDTNSAYQLATQWLNAISIDVRALNHDLRLFVDVDNKFVAVGPGKFVPIYTVSWCKKWTPVPGVVYSNPPEWDSIASVKFVAPTKTLLELRVEEDKYILRPPLVFTNLSELLRTTDSIPPVCQPDVSSTCRNLNSPAKSNQVIELHP